MVNKDVPNVITSTLAEVTELDDNQKEELLDYCNTSFDNVQKEKGKAVQTKILLNKNKSKKMILICEDESLKRKRPTLEETVNSSNLPPKVKRSLIKEYEDKQITKNHVYDVLKANLNIDFSSSDEKQQKQIVNNIIKNRNQINMNNSQDIAFVLAKNLDNDPRVIDFWFEGTVKLIKNLTEKLDIDPEWWNVIDASQKQSLKKSLSELTAVIDKANVESK